MRLRHLRDRSLALGCLVGVWMASAQIAGPTVVPGPFATLDALCRMAGQAAYWASIAQSLRVFAMAFGLAALLAIPCGIGFALVPRLGRAMEPFVFALAATPRVAFVPLLIVLLGLGDPAKVALVFLGASIPILLNTWAGVRHADPDLVEMARAVGVSRWQRVAWVILPAALPMMVTGLRLGATIGLINTVVAELYTAIGGLGGLLARYGASFRMAEYMAIVVTLSVVGVVISSGLYHLEKFVKHRME
ncbi:Putative aliphatic sulfonates transport permease protein SsuC [Aquimixticola soesokkakensis]|uniref:Putative aliphatic sulfonates transport permease protein SsuC n=1 Tax=Aquimixticola soesokkakensis TaxID=1519096 RepID=A0A1Y5TGP7_9RHOB|nr:ABC transporter permease subunit [Aquimixticola soesokkakensis]SLN63781.1 Putative aliphatic sulfonates transport permease protein SsuC [Aquimixticola soesokkakensis]